MIDECYAEHLYAILRFRPISIDSERLINKLRHFAIHCRQYRKICYTHLIRVSDFGHNVNVRYISQRRVALISPESYLVNHCVINVYY